MVGGADNVASVLPLSDRTCGERLLPLRAGAGSVLTEGASGATPGELPIGDLHVESDDDIFVLPETQEPAANQKLQELCLSEVQICWSPRPLPEWPDGVELVFFRVCHKSIVSLKRPMQSIDNIRPDDIALRFYDVHGLSITGDKVDLVDRNGPDVCGSSLFTASFMHSVRLIHFESW